MSDILPSPKVVLDFTDGAGTAHHVELMWDFYSPTEFSDPSR